MAEMVKGWSLCGWMAAVLMLVPACGLEYAVRLRADEDLNCPDDQIEVENDDGPTDYVARGCGSEQQYTCSENVASSISPRCHAAVSRSLNLAMRSLTSRLTTHGSPITAQRAPYFVAARRTPDKPI